MGNVIASGMAAKQEEMMEKQKISMRENLDRQMRLMQASQIAVARERFWWMLGGYGMIALGAAVSFRRTRKIPEAMMGPLAIYPLILGYQADMCFYNKADRIRRDFYHILDEENIWLANVEREYQKKSSGSSAPDFYAWEKEKWLNKDKDSKKDD